MKKQLESYNPLNSAKINFSDEPFIMLKYCNTILLCVVVIYTLHLKGLKLFNSVS